MYILCASLLACAPNQGSPPGEDSDVEARQGKLTSNFTLEELREIAAEADNDEIGDVEVNSIQTLNRDFREANTETRLFEEDLSSDEARFNRLETAVQDIHTELESITPGVNRLIAIEQDIRDLHSKLSTLVEGQQNPATQASSAANQTQAPEPRRASLNNSSSVTPQPEPDPAPQPATPPADPTPPVEEYLPSADIQADLIEAEDIIEEKIQQIETIEQNNGVAMELRAWESAGKTRVVFETPEKEDYQLNYDASNAVITVTTDQRFSEEQLSTIERNSNQIVTTDVQYGTDTATLTIEVQDVSSISSGYYLPPESDTLTHRYYFDIIK